MPHNPMLTIRENMQLDQIRTRKDSDAVVSEIGLLTDVIPGTYEDGPVPTTEDLFNRLKSEGFIQPDGNVNLEKVFTRGSMGHIFHSDLCPEVLTMPQSLFQHAGHMWLHTHHRWSNSSITGTVELYIPTAEDLNPTPVTLFEGELHKDYDGDQPIMRGSHFSGLVEITKGMSQCSRNETMAYMIVDRPDHVMDPLLAEVEDHATPGFLVLLDDDGKPVSREEQLEYEQAVLKDQEEAIQEASEGKLDYLLEGTQWDPKLRKS